MKKKPGEAVTVFLRRRLKIFLLRWSRRQVSNRVGTYRGKWAGMSGHLESEPRAEAYTELHEETSLEREDVSTPDSGRAAGYIRRENQGRRGGFTYFSPG